MEAKFKIFVLFYLHCCFIYQVKTVTFPEQVAELSKQLQAGWKISPEPVHIVQPGELLTVSFSFNNTEIFDCKFYDHANEKDPHIGRVRAYRATSCTVPISVQNTMPIRCELAINSPRKIVDGFILLIVFETPTVGIKLDEEIFEDGKELKATCYALNGIPPAINFEWKLGNDVIRTSNLPNIPDQTLTSNLIKPSTSSHSLTHIVSWKDHGKNLTCSVSNKHYGTKSDSKQLNIAYINFSDKEYRLNIGTSATISIEVIATGKPTFVWKVAGNPISEGGSDFIVYNEEKDSFTWNATLIINNVTQAREDDWKKIQLQVTSFKIPDELDIKTKVCFPHQEVCERIKVISTTEKAVYGTVGALVILISIVCFWLVYTKRIRLVKVSSQEQTLAASVNTAEEIPEVTGNKPLPPIPNDGLEMQPRGHASQGHRGQLFQSPNHQGHRGQLPQPPNRQGRRGQPTQLPNHHSHPPQGHRGQLPQTPNHQGHRSQPHQGHHGQTGRTPDPSLYQDEPPEELYQNTKKVAGRRF